MALIFLREPISFEGVIGLMLVIGGSFVYGWVRDMEMAATKHMYVPVSPASNKDDDDMDIIEMGGERDKATK